MQGASPAKAFPYANFMWTVIVYYGSRHLSSSQLGVLSMVPGIFAQASLGFCL